MTAIRWAALATCAALAAGQARADVAYRFVETSYDVAPVGLPDIVLSDAAVAAGGVSLSYECTSSLPSCFVPSNGQLPDPAADGYLAGLGANLSSTFSIFIRLAVR